MSTFILPRELVDRINSALGRTGLNGLQRELQGAVIASAPPAPVEPVAMPVVPDEVIKYVHAYGDSRADDDGLSALRIAEAILAMRRWGASLSTPQEARNLLPRGFISDVMTAAGLVAHGKQCKALSERLGNDCMSILSGKAQEAPEGLTDEAKAAIIKDTLGEFRNGVTYDRDDILAIMEATAAATLAKVKPS